MILLLTGCIDPDGMTYTALSSPEERQRQYVEAIRFYLARTHYPVVFAENSGTDISHLFSSEIKSGRLEFLTFHGNHAKDRGKGYGECEILEHALQHSHIIQHSPRQRIAKITGRLKVRNINAVSRWHTLLTTRMTTLFSINSDMSFPDSRLMIAPKEFYQAFLTAKDSIDDSRGYYFEHALIDTLIRERRFSWSPFFIMPQIQGMSGSTGQQYVEGSPSLYFRLRYARYGLHQLLLFCRKFRC